MVSMFRNFSCFNKVLLSLCLLLALLLTGCCNTPFCKGRRPQVIATWDNSIIDYDFDCFHEVNDENDCQDNHEANAGKEHDSQYRLAIGDLLEISILGEEETFVENAVVAPDGKIYYAFLDGVPAIGRTVPEVAEEMQDKLKKLFINPLVTINSTLSTTYNYKILGRVNKPGVYPINGELHLREAIGEAGGIVKRIQTDERDEEDLYSTVNLGDSYIVRDGKKLEVDFYSLIHNPSRQADILIKPGDFIYLAPNEINDVYVLGAVATSRRVSWYQGLTLMGAISDASGWRYGSPWSADLHSILIVRGNLECPCAMQVDVTLILSGMARDVILQPGDIIYVHNKTLRFGRALVLIAINSFIQSFATAGASYYGFRWFPPETLHNTTNTNTNTND